MLYSPRRGRLHLLPSGKQHFQCRYRTDLCQLITQYCILSIFYRERKLVQLFHRKSYRFSQCLGRGDFLPVWQRIPGHRRIIFLGGGEESGQGGHADQKGKACGRSPEADGQDLPGGRNRL